MPLLSVHQLSLTLGEQHILRGVDFSVEEGSVIGIIGPNGSGKTTLFNVLSGFLAPTHGVIKFRDTDITEMPAHERARIGIGRVFQNFGVFREMTLEENVRVALEALGPTHQLALGDFDKKIAETLRMVGLFEHRSKLAGSLSGGQMRLLEISRTLAAGKDLFLLDEPTAGVSPKMRGDIAALIQELKLSHKTVLVIEHDLPFIRKICDHVIVLDIGSIALHGTPDEVSASKKLKELYFGADPTN